MPRIRDASTVVNKIGLWSLIKQLYARVNDKNLLVWASALAYSWLFSLFPFIILVLTLLPYLPGTFKHGMTSRVQSAVFALPPKASETVWGVVGPMMKQLLHQPPRGLLSVGALVTIWAASSGMSMTMYAMDRCWGVTKFRPYYRQRALAILLTIVEAGLILVVLILLPIGTLVTHWMVDNIGHVASYIAQHSQNYYAAVPQFVSDHIAGLIIVWQIVRFAIALLLLFTATAIIYFYGPNVRRKFRWITPGSIFAVAVWIILGFFFRLYVDYFGKSYETYGTVGGVAILLLFFYIDAVVLLIGCELNSQLEDEMKNIPQ